MLELPGVCPTATQNVGEAQETLFQSTVLVLLFGISERDHPGVLPCAAAVMGDVAAWTIAARPPKVAASAIRDITVFTILFVGFVSMPHFHRKNAHIFVRAPEVCMGWVSCTRPMSRRYNPDNLAKKSRLIADCLARYLVSRPMSWPRTRCRGLIYDLAVPRIRKIHSADVAVTLTWRQVVDNLTPCHVYEGIWDRASHITA